MQVGSQIFSVREAGNIFIKVFLRDRTHICYRVSYGLSFLKVDQITLKEFFSLVCQLVSLPDWNVALCFVNVFDYHFFLLTSALTY